MHHTYAIITGPLFLVSLALFLFGVVYRFASILILAKQKETFVFSYISFKYSLRSLYHWMLPFMSSTWQLNPVFTIVTFAFHLCCVAIPFLLLSHVILIEEFFGLRWWTLPDAVSDFATIIVIMSLVFFFVRRLFYKKVKFVTTVSDYVLLFLVAVPFITGFMAYHQFFIYDVFLITHIVSAEILLISIPHTRLKHMFLFFLTRSYMGSEFGKIRNAKDW